MKKIITAICSIAFAVAALFLLQRLVVPKYMEDVLEGSFIREYYDETTAHDVIMVGDCEVYENFSPIEMWNQYGITGYIRGSAQQLIWQSYYMLEDTLKYETPKVVIYNVQSMVYNTPQKEEYNRMTIDGMRWSKTKWDCIQASMLEEESVFDYLFPILRYHERITELGQSDFNYFWNKRKVTQNGYYMRIDTMPYDEENALEESKPENTTFGNHAWDYLNRMRDLCKSKGIVLVLVKAPSLSPVWFDEYEHQIQKYAKENNLDYINYLKLVKKLKIDYETDTYDGGLHMNLSGAKKLSAHLGGYLVKKYHLADHRGEVLYRDAWKEKVDFYDQMIAEQEKELKEYGYLKSFGGEAEKTQENKNNSAEDEQLEDIFGGFE